MANRKSKRTTNKRPKGVRKATVSWPRFTEAERQYAQLLADPCNGPLVSGPFGDGSGGIVSRFEKDFLINTGATETAAAYVFIPGEPRSYTASNPLVLGSTDVTWQPVDTLSVGHPFLATNASSFRCLACCVQVYWPGTELERQGVVSIGQFQGDLLFDGITTPDELRIASPYVERTPAGVMEMKWRPNEYDTQWSQAFVEAEGIAGGAFTGKKSAIAVSGAGLGTAKGLRVRIVAVYEWKPRPSQGLGMIVSNGHGTVKTGSLSNVLSFLDRTGDWMYNGAHAIGHTASKLAAGVGSILSLSNGLGRMGRAIMAV